MDLIVLVLVEAGGGIYCEINYEFVELIPFMTRYNTTMPAVSGRVRVWLMVMMKHDIVSAVIVSPGWPGAGHLPAVNSRLKEAGCGVAEL